RFPISPCTVRTVCSATRPPIRRSVRTILAETAYNVTCRPSNGVPASLSTIIGSAFLAGRTPQNRPTSTTPRRRDEVAFADFGDPCRAARGQREDRSVADRGPSGSLECHHSTDTRR